jgi:hypothetical protein
MQHYEGGVGYVWAAECANKMACWRRGRADHGRRRALERAHGELLCRRFEATSAAERARADADLDELLAAHPWLRPAD